MIDKAAYYIGVMSGTSLDGIDVVITRFDSVAGCEFIGGQTYPFPGSLQDDLQTLINQPYCGLHQLAELDIALGQAIAAAVKQLLGSQQIPSSTIGAIGCHGQTVLHSPNSTLPFSLQIGNAHHIAEITGITTVADFRQRDIAAGGQGAPLVPAFHHRLFNDSNEDRVIVNIGGISNITVLPTSPHQPILGFDTGPGNVLLDHWVQQHRKQAYDKAGEWAACGSCNAELLATLLAEPYFAVEAPKSTGRELFNPQWLNAKLSQFDQAIAAVDVQATLLELTVLSLANAINIYANKGSGIYLCGGGAHNTQLMRRLQSVLSDMTISTTMELGLHPDWVEACAFAWLAQQTMTQQAGNLPAVTGTEHPVVLGAIYSGYLSSDAS